MYQVSQVAVNIGRASKPGINSNTEIKPIQLKKYMQNESPTMSTRSPATGIISRGKTYSIKSRLTQTIKVTTSSQKSRISQGSESGFTDNFPHSFDGIGNIKVKLRLKEL